MEEVECYRGVIEYRNLNTGEVKRIATKTYDTPAKARGAMTRRRNNRQFWYGAWTGYGDNVIERSQEDRMPITDYWLEKVESWVRV